MRLQKALDLRKSSWMMNAMNELVTRRNILKTTSLLIAGSAVGKTLMAEGAGPIQDLAQTLLPQP